MTMTPGKDKWILDKHTNDFSAVINFALDLQNTIHGGEVSDSTREYLWRRQMESGAHSTRTPGSFTFDSVNHFFMTLKYYMFGYVVNVGNGIKNRENERFVFSPLGRLYLKEHVASPNSTALPKIFLGLLFALQFPSPADRQLPGFELYPFRLIIKLLLDPRLQGRLYHNEMEYLVMFVKDIDKSSYETLVKNILKLRHLGNEDMARAFRQDETTFVKCVYEWEYYTVKFLAGAGIFEVHSGDPICTLFHPVRHAGHTTPTHRTATRGYVQIAPPLVGLAKTMSDVYPFDTKPLSFASGYRTMEDTTKQILGFYPKEIVAAVGESNLSNDLVELSASIDQYSLHPTTQSAYQFERALCAGFNWFKNVKASHIGGAGHTDIECVYTKDGNFMKFDIDAKSTDGKLTGINPGRLGQHRIEVGSQYTIIITPGYVPAAKRDIENQPIVILLASTFSEYLMNFSLENPDSFDFSELDTIIRHNLGTDISPLVSQLTANRFGASAASLTTK